MKNPVLKMFFKHDNASNRSECNLCKKFITGKHSSNLEKHVFAHHKLQYADLIKAKNKLKQTIENLDAETSLTNKINNSQSTLNNFVSISKKSIKLNLDKNSLIAACIEMVTINGRPLTLLQDSGFRKILDPVLDAFLPEKIAINSQNIKGHITHLSNNIVSDITKDLKNRMVSLKIDGVSRHSRSFLGINVQYISCDSMQLQIKTLSISEVLGGHTAEN
ncbi:uncharacterized protein LOC126909940, partial [Daktulosphaira vitifoliae]|uniref:uncharacterized protein LOC126909940 n=1 Tax=Daktulosphaira vitifoliae TaxID=58002 RepID=UPI0021A9F674